MLANLCHASLLEMSNKWNSIFLAIYLYFSSTELKNTVYSKLSFLRIRSDSRMHHVMWTCKLYKTQTSCVELVLVGYFYVKQESFKTHFSAKHSVIQEGEKNKGMDLKWKRK